MHAQAATSRGSSNFQWPPKNTVELVLYRVFLSLARDLF